jgi:hypothetical protein
MMDGFGWVFPYGPENQFVPFFLYKKKSKQRSEIEIPLSEAIRASLPVLSMSLWIIKLNV